MAARWVCVMAEFPALPLWTDAYLADTAHLSYEEHGLYFHILMTMWRTPGCQIPNDPEWVNKRFRGNANAVLTLCEEFCTLSEDKKWWHQKRLRKQWVWCKEKSQKNAEIANSRWNKNKASCERTANAMPLNLNPNPNPLRGGNRFLMEEKKERTFRAAPGTAEFRAWKADSVDKNPPLARELAKRELENRPFEFESQWPPGYQPPAPKLAVGN